ncbi:lysine-specific demethylase 8-like isoform X1 [Belonocnema kinseyi]|uniref:lysine-specific demethylase 8-like isoform X1 n=1 Tax=Belonocnema kinseyi TaxID=2817044 RepID=UPI00143D5753|nr:lysine-specific demethylase 8-like isoform X1 [Belonocnema kinseyi]XP_033226639.1 lysine-specific demethylase 8-like isoform X1 [Belonocnema kinseyi]XP_033226640.1 lysine-specific demethylase 8-like isoform X1 [Belonocnema kinseyi]XP_033226641.1 lysine-specific demethylase 8-like isoform X1 [Belonocnema kinseyi]
MLKKAPLTTESISWESLIQESKENVPEAIKINLEPIIEVLKNLDRENKGNISAEWVENSLLRLEACLDRTWEMLNSGYWKDVPIQYRYSYTLCSILKSVFLEIQNETNIEHSSTTSKMLVETIKQIDKGILLGAPLQSSPDLLTTIASRLNSHFLKSTLQDDVSKLIEIDETDICTELFPEFLSVPHYEEPSMETFYRDIFKPKVPALIQGCMNHWKALKLWKNTEYLKRVAGMRTVPIEMGSRYTEEDWAQKLLTFSEFLKTHISSKCAEIGYLAQHQLFQQIPELKEDFSVPDFCSFSDEENGESLPDINAWFGPGGTVSPLHYDPKNNLLCQVFGYKRIILYNPEDSENLYPFETRMLCNTAQVDPYHPDYEKWPNFRKTKGLMCYLKPGEMLFIPPRWWHHVVGLSPSFSISFWWD